MSTCRLLPGYRWNSIATYFNKYILKQASTENYWTIRHHSFKAPTRPKLKIADQETDYAKGRYDPNLFSEEYIPPLVQPEWHRNKLKYRLERMDCLRRRQVVEIPEFYPGSILAVTIADQHAVGKTSRFVGRCLYNDGFGLGCKFCLRNILDGEGIEMTYHLYGPYIQTIEVLQLEKWIDTDLRYLRDADPTICTIDPKMSAIAPTPTSEELPVFQGKVKMNKMPWSYQYHKQWPRPYNVFLEEFFLEEELLENERFIELNSWRHFDICRHYDLYKVKPEIIQEMKDNKQRVEVADAEPS